MHGLGAEGVNIALAGSLRARKARSMRCKAALIALRDFSTTILCPSRPLITLVKLSFIAMNSILREFP